MDVKNELSSMTAGTMIAITLSVMAFIFSLGSLIVGNNATAPQPTFAVFNPEKALNDLTKEQAKNASSVQEAEQLIDRARMQMEAWIQVRLPIYCPSPCIVFDQESVTYSSTLDLNEIIISDLKR
jgi:hypothetical protein